MELGVGADAFDPPVRWMEAPVSKKKKSKKADAGLMSSAGRFASRNRRALGLAGAGLAAALFLGRRYRSQRETARWADDEAVGGAAI